MMLGIGPLLLVLDDALIVTYHSHCLEASEPATHAEASLFSPTFGASNALGRAVHQESGLWERLLHPSPLPR
ncbi:hypothetical protein BS78_02G247900 [Paspalum vaginatum]|nr:hypothetical protein BS78_02G247900 [Paspalum vaginatum]